MNLFLTIAPLRFAIANLNLIYFKTVKAQSNSNSISSSRSHKKLRSHRHEPLLDVGRHFFGQLATVEISTAIVDEITEDLFIPWEVYQHLYEISRASLVDSAMPPELQNRYWQLRRQLELEYHLRLLDPDFPLYSRHSQAEIANNLEILAQNNAAWEHLNSQLPPPLSSDRQSTLAVKQLLNDRYFLSVLRRLGKFKTALDRRQKLLPTEKILARTSIQLDGTITHCYCQELFEHPQQGRILKLHDRAIANGEQQWRGLIKFALDLLKK